MKPHLSFYVIIVQTILFSVSKDNLCRIFLTKLVYRDFKLFIYSVTIKLFYKLSFVIQDVKVQMSNQCNQILTCTFKLMDHVLVYLNTQKQHNGWSWRITVKGRWKARDALLLQIILSASNLIIQLDKAQHLH